MLEQQTKKFTFVDTTARRKIWGMKKRFRGVKGGTSASKTISIMSWHIDYCQQKRQTPEICTIASETYPHLEGGVIRDFKAIMKDRGYWDDSRWNSTKHFYTFETGNILEFESVDTYGKAHGPRRHVLWLNECNNLPWIIVDQLIIRTHKIVWMDWNPVEDFWFHDEILPHRSEEVDYLTLNYLDNEALGEITIRDIESHKHDENWWNVYGLGLDGVLQTRIYPNWIMLDEIPAEARLKVKGLDFGYTNDPTALVDVYEWNNAYIVDEVLYEKGLLNNQIATAIGKNQPITIGDSAEPKSITEIAQHGVNIIGSKKGKGSILHGIDAVQAKTIYVTKRSLNIIKENRNYIWLKDDTGKIINEPRDLFNHAMDAIRYAIAFLNPKTETTGEGEVEDRPYETPSLRQEGGTPIIPTLSTKTRIELMRQSRKATSFETEVPWQKPGL